MHLASCSANCINSGSNEMFERACALVQATLVSTCVKLASTYRLIKYIRLADILHLFATCCAAKKQFASLYFLQNRYVSKLIGGGGMQSRHIVISTSNFFHILETFMEKL